MIVLEATPSSSASCTEASSPSDRNYWIVDGWRNAVVGSPRDAQAGVDGFERPVVDGAQGAERGALSVAPAGDEAVAVGAGLPALDVLDVALAKDGVDERPHLPMGEDLVVGPGSFWVSPGEAGGLFVGSDAVGHGVP